MRCKAIHNARQIALVQALKPCGSAFEIRFIALRFFPTYQKLATQNPLISCFIFLQTQ